jgi:hypothetical protein
MPAPDKAVFRLPTSALFIPLGLFVFATPLAAASVWTLPLYLLPVYGLFWVLVTRTVADDRTIEAHLPLRTRRIPWADLDGFEFQGPRWAIAVTQEGKRIRLPMVRPRDLRRLAEVSGGRLYLGEDAAAQAEEAADASSASTSLRTGAPPAGDTATVPTDAPTPPDGTAEAAPAAPEPTTDDSPGTPPGTDGTEAATPVRAASSDDAGRRAPQAE